MSSVHPNFRIPTVPRRSPLARLVNVPPQPEPDATAFTKSALVASNGGDPGMRGNCTVGLSASTHQSPRWLCAVALAAKAESIARADMAVR
jgi:hypothetical protein